MRGGSTKSKKTSSKAHGTDNGPRFELRVAVKNSNDWQIEIWQMPAPSTPRLKMPEHVATLKGAPLRLLESRVLKRLARANIHPGVLKADKKKEWPLEEEDALYFGLLFRTLAPMRNLDRIREVADGIEAMSREESAYWLGMALHREKPRRVLAALRLLLTMA